MGLQYGPTKHCPMKPVLLCRYLEHQLDHWVALSRAFETNSHLAQEITAAFEPVRQALRREFGDTITMHRGRRKFTAARPPIGVQR